MNEKTFYPQARKRFGQNFLHDQAVIDDIVAAISPEPGQHLVEIGPGRGALTEPLLQQSDTLDVIELDRDLIPLLEAQLGQHAQLKIHQADALQFDYRLLQREDELLRIIGNLPYNITTPLLFHLLAQAECIEDMCFMLQREVVQRICAQPGTKQYGKLSIMIQYQCEASLLFIVPPEAFTPIPKVESAIIYLKPRLVRPGGDVPLQALRKLVLQAFSQRRKTIANTLKSMVSVETLQAAGLQPGQRPETVSVVEYVHLCQQWLQNQNETS